MPLTKFRVGQPCANQICRQPLAVISAEVECANPVHTQEKHAVLHLKPSRCGGAGRMRNLASCSKSLHHRPPKKGQSTADCIVVRALRDFPEKSGLSARNLKYMRAFAEAHTDPEVVQQVVAQNPLQSLRCRRRSSVRPWLVRRARIKNRDPKLIDIFGSLALAYVTVVQFKQQASDPLAPFIQYRFDVLNQ